MLFSGGRKPCINVCVDILVTILEPLPRVVMRMLPRIKMRVSQKCTAVVLQHYITKITRLQVQGIVKTTSSEVEFCFQIVCEIFQLQV